MTIVNNVNEQGERDEKKKRKKKNQRQPPSVASEQEKKKKTRQIAPASQPQYASSPSPTRILSEESPVAQIVRVVVDSIVS